MAGSSSGDGGYLRQAGCSFTDEGNFNVEAGISFATPDGCQH